MTSDVYHTANWIALVAVLVPAAAYSLVFVATSSRRTWRTAETIPLLLFPAGISVLTARSLMIRLSNDPEYAPSGLGEAFALAALIFVAVAMWGWLFMLFAARNRRWASRRRAERNDDRSADG